MKNRCVHHCLARGRLRAVVGVGLGLVLTLGIVSQSFAHPEGFSGMRVKVAEDGVHVAVTLHTRDMGDWFAPAKHPDYVRDVCRALEGNPNDVVELRVEDRPVGARAVRASSPEVGMVELDVEYPPLASSSSSSAAGAVSVLVWSKHLSRLPRGHQQLLTVEDARGAGAAVSLCDTTLSVEEDSATFNVPVMAGASPKTSAGPLPRLPPRRISFFLLGVQHIVTGYDHLLFLAALLLVCRGFREAASVITFFTVAHSITLTLAALGMVRLPARIVEPAIAASIVYVGVENLAGRHKLLWRAAITFAFGLVHGLGFAAALREVGLGSTSLGIAWPLVKFSAGLESGQLLIAAVVLQVMLALRRYRPRAFERKWVPGGSVAVACVGGYWLIARVLAG
jgi:hydrogenase/urease accessory protein HupE